MKTPMNWKQMDNSAKSLLDCASPSLRQPSLRQPSLRRRKQSRNQSILDGFVPRHDVHSHVPRHDVHSPVPRHDVQGFISRFFYFLINIFFTINSIMPFKGVARCKSASNFFMYNNTVFRLGTMLAFAAWLSRNVLFFNLNL